MTNRIRRILSDSQPKKEEIPLEQLVANLKIPKIKLSTSVNSNLGLSTKIHILNIDYRGEIAVGVFPYNRNRIEVPIGIRFNFGYSEKFFSIDRSGGLNELGVRDDTIYLMIESSKIRTEFHNSKEEEIGKTHDLACLVYKSLQKIPLFLYIHGEENKLLGYYIEEGELKMCTLLSVPEECKEAYTRLKKMQPIGAIIKLPDGAIDISVSEPPIDKGLCARDIKEIEEWMRRDKRYEDDMEIR